MRSGEPADVTAATAEHAPDGRAPSYENGRGHHQHEEHGGHAGHGGHGDHAAQFRDTFWLSLLLALPVIFFSPMVGDLLGYAPPDFPGSRWVAPVLGTVIFVYGGQPFLTGGWSEARSRRPGMMLLIGMAITVAFVASWVTTLGIGGFDLDFWWELALLIVIMLLGHWLEMRALGAASGALGALAALLPDTAERVTDSGVHEVPTTELVSGDVVLVRSGGRVPADGVVVQGRAAVDESMVTGESAPVDRGEDDTVVAGTVATDNALRVRVTAVGEDTALAGIGRLVSEAQSSSSRAQALADRAAALLFYFASTAGVLTFVAWALFGDLNDAVTRTVTVLVIACPHALGLAIPLVIAISTERAAASGVLVKDRLALERMRQVDVVLFDKTGTLTKGQPVVTDLAVVDHVAVTDRVVDGGVVDACAVTDRVVDGGAVTGGVVDGGSVDGGSVNGAGLDHGGLLALAAAVESDSEHPLARAIVQRHRSETGREAPAAEDFRSSTGRGVQATVDGATVTVGGPALLREVSAVIPAELAATTASWSARGATVLHVLRDGAVIGAVALEDEVREESRHAVDALHQRGVTVAMITGDARPVADAVAERLGIDEVFAEVLPQDKDGKVLDLQRRGHRVAMVGDGVNDAPALARAEVGIAIGAGTDVAIESAGVVLASDDPRSVLSVIDLSRASYRKMWQNLVWASGYNLISVPLAAGVLAFAGIVLSPAVGAVLMSLSTIVVAANAQLLRRLDLRPGAARGQ